MFKTEGKNNFKTWKNSTENLEGYVAEATER